MFEFDKYCLKDEVWKPIPFYKGLYEASNLGRIRTVDGKQTHSALHGTRKWRGKILKNKTKKVNSQTGYRVTLWKDKKPKDLLVARLVCLAFYGIPKDYDLTNTGERATVNHKDGDRLNNKIENLEWLSLSENIRHAFKNDLMSSCKKVALVDKKNNKIEFNSLSKASKYLKRNTGYISCCLKRNCEITSTDGSKYKCILL